MGFDISAIKNVDLRNKMLLLKAKTLNQTPRHGPSATPAEPAKKSAAEPPKSTPVSVSSSTIIKSWPEKSTEIFFTVKGEPMGKPRMTQRDKWQKRPCVLRYREYCDKIRAEAGNVPDNPLAVHIKAFIPMAASWSQKKKAENLGRRQRLKPDWDNIGKAICDALFEEDSCIAVGITEKFWCAPGAERTEVRVIYEESVLTRYGIGIDLR
jgi:Holliday junction resolvase RusA-like endonuclease